MSHPNPQYDPEVARLWQGDNFDPEGEEPDYDLMIEGK